MHTFIQKDGTKIETARFMQGPTLTPGYWWSQEAPLGSWESVWREVVKPPTPRADTIFGYEERAFMARQYK
jgi:hypothetical protein